MDTRLELHRQLVHLSGFLFVILAQFTGSFLAGFYFLIIAFTLFLYSEFVRRQQKVLWGLVDRFEEKFREFAVKLERKEVYRPFAGAIWFYFGCGLAFLLFPLNIASAACIMLSIGDALSTLAGIKFGKHKILKNKSVEGSATLFITSLIISQFFVPLNLAIIGSLTATFVELIPDMPSLKQLKKKSLVDDNYLIPLISGLVMFMIQIFI